MLLESICSFCDSAVRPTRPGASAGPSARPSQSSPRAMFSKKAVRHVAGHSRLLWFIPIFSLVLGLVVAALSTDPQPDRLLITFWSAVAVTSALASLLVFYLRHIDQRFLKDLDARLLEAPLSYHPVLRRYEIEVGLVLLNATFHTPLRPETDPRGRFDLWLACGVTALLGWWSLLGIIRVPIVLMHNLRGGQKVRAEDFVEALRRAPV